MKILFFYFVVDINLVIYYKKLMLCKLELRIRTEENKDDVVDNGMYILIRGIEIIWKVLL